MRPLPSSNGWMKTNEKAQTAAATTGWTSLSSMRLVRTIHERMSSGTSPGRGQMKSTCSRYPPTVMPTKLWKSRQSTAPYRGSTMVR